MIGSFYGDEGINNWIYADVICCYPPEVAVVMQCRNVLKAQRGHLMLPCAVLHCLSVTCVQIHRSPWSGNLDGRKRIISYVSFAVTHVGNLYYSIYSLRLSIISRTHDQGLWGGNAFSRISVPLNQNNNNHLVLSVRPLGKEEFYAGTNNQRTKLLLHNWMWISLCRKQVIFTGFIIGENSEMKIRTTGVWWGQVNQGLRSHRKECLG